MNRPGNKLFAASALAFHEHRKWSRGRPRCGVSQFIRRPAGPQYPKLAGHDPRDTRLPIERHLNAGRTGHRRGRDQRLRSRHVRGPFRSPSTSQRAERSCAVANGNGGLYAVVSPGRPNQHSTSNGSERCRPFVRLRAARRDHRQRVACHAKEGHPGRTGALADHSANSAKRRRFVVRALAEIQHVDDIVDDGRDGLQRLRAARDVWRRTTRSSSHAGPRRGSFVEPVQQDPPRRAPGAPATPAATATRTRGGAEAAARHGAPRHAGLPRREHALRRCGV